MHPAARLGPGGSTGRGEMPGGCVRCFVVPVQQEPRSERSSSRTRGTHRASDAPTGSAHGGSRAAPRPAVRAKRRRRARNIVQGAVSCRAQCRRINNQGQRGAAAAPEWRIWPTTAPALGCPRGLTCCSTPRCSCPAAPPCAEKAQGTALGDSRCRCTKNRGRSRSSSRTRGTPGIRRPPRVARPQHRLPRRKHPTPRRS